MITQILEVKNVQGPTCPRNIYLAHNYGAREWLRSEVVPYLESRSHNITSRWIIWPPIHDSNIEGPMDLEDIDKASHVVFFTGQYSERPGRGKFVELGYAIRAGKTVIMVGEDNGCVFYKLPTLRWADSYQSILRYL